LFLRRLPCQNKTMKTSVLLPLLALCWLTLTPGSLAQQRPVSERLLYPAAPVRQLHYSGGQTVYAQYLELPVEQVLLHYLRKAREPGWRLTFPDALEAEAWLRALQQRPQEPPVFVLNLYHPKTDVNVHLTIGGLPGTSPSRGRSIITLYSTKHPLGGRQGG
jgi:hypothetical protein